MYVTVMPVSAYMALAFVFGFIQRKLMMMMMVRSGVTLAIRHRLCGPSTYGLSGICQVYECLYAVGKKVPINFCPG